MFVRCVAVCVCVCVCGGRGQGGGGWSGGTAGYAQLVCGSLDFT